MTTFVWIQRAIEPRKIEQEVSSTRVLIAIILFFDEAFLFTHIIVFLQWRQHYDTRDVIVDDDTPEIFNRIFEGVLWGY